MRISIVSRIYRPEPSAAASFLGAIADDLASNGHEVLVYTTSLPKGKKRKPSIEKVHEFPAIRDKNDYIRGYFQYLSFDLPLFFRLMFSQKPDVYFVEPPPTTGLVVRLVSKFKNIPYVYDVADIWSDAAIHATSFSLIVRILRWVEKIAIGGAEKLVTISSGVVEQLNKFNLNKTISVTGFGANTDEFRYVQAARKEIFLYAGTYSRLHGARILIDAFSLFLKEFPTYKLQFVGNGTEKNQLIERAKNLGIETQIEFIDSIPPGELNKLFSSATASVATLLPGGGYEYAFTTKIYSSIACGCPIIFSGPGPTNDFIRDTKSEINIGEIAKYDKYSISKAMKKIVQDQYSDQDREDIARWTESNHSMQSVANKVVKVIESIETKQNLDYV